MLYSGKHMKKKSLALLLAGTLFLGNVPVYATSDNDIEFSSSESDEMEADITPSGDDMEPDIELSDETDSSTEESSHTTETEADSVDFASGDEEASFSSGNESDNTPADYILGRPMTEEERQAQLDPLKSLVSFPAEEEVNSDLNIATYALYPDTYDARQEHLVTSVKNQGSLNLCWAFSLASNMETSLLSRALGSFDLSEEHLAYFWSHRADDPLGNTPNDQIIRTRGDYHGTGNGRVASFFLSTWSGMVTEAKVPLRSSSQSYDSSLAYATDAYMEDAVFSTYDVERTKALLTEYHSVSAMLNMQTDYYCADTAAYNYPVIDNPKLVNHAITIVGWNDNYSRDNFPEASDVQNDGAWIVKNSYGSSWGDNGYFYLSYEDKSISNLVCNTAVTAPAYPNNYFYDGASVGTVTFPSGTVSSGYYISNIFRATAGNGNDEELGEIVTAVPQDHTEFQIQIYTDLTDPSNPTSGTPAYPVALSYTQPLAGIHTIRLETPVTIPADTQYSVVLKIPDGTAKYYVEKSVFSNPNDHSNSWFQAIAGIDPNQSFYSSKGLQWTDAGTGSSGYCFSLKAHTRTLEPPAPATFQVNYNKNIRSGVGNFPSSVSAQDGTTIAIAGAPYCNSRFFTGWNTRADGKGTSYSPGQKIPLGQDLTLYAQWSINYTSSARLTYRVTGKQTVTCCGTTNSRISKISIPTTISYRGVTYRVTSVAANAFKKKSRLATVSIGNNISVIDKNAFYNCKNLKKVTIGTGLTQINTNAFRGVKKGCTITIKSLKLRKISSRIDSAVSKMTVRVPKKKYTAYKKLLRKKSKTVIVR